MNTIINNLFGRFFPAPQPQPTGAARVAGIINQFNTIRESLIQGVGEINQEIDHNEDTIEVLKARNVTLNVTASQANGLAAILGGHQ
jgi:hypothetical protein